MTVDAEEETGIGSLDFSRPPPPLPTRKRKRREKQAMSQQKTIVIPPEGNVNFCTVGQCYRRRARQNFVQFYMRIGWSSTRFLSLPARPPPPPALPNCHVPRVARCAFTWHPTSNAGERPSLPRTHLHLVKPIEFLYSLDGTDPKTKRRSPANYRKPSRGGGG